MRFNFESLQIVRSSRCDRNNFFWEENKSGDAADSAPTYSKTMLASLAGSCGRILGAITAAGGPTDSDGDDDD